MTEEEAMECLAALEHSFGIALGRLTDRYEDGSEARSEVWLHEIGHETDRLKSVDGAEILVIRDTFAQAVTYLVSKLGHHARTVYVRGSTGRTGRRWTLPAFSSAEELRVKLAAMSGAEVSG